MDIIELLLTSIDGWINQYIIIELTYKAKCLGVIIDFFNISL